MMRSISLLLVLVSFISLSANKNDTLVSKQKLDTIEASTSQITTIAFSGQIKDFVSPDRNKYAIQNVDNILYIQALQKTTKPTTLIVRYVGGIYVAYLKYSEEPKTVFYPLYGLNFEVHDRGSNFMYNTMEIKDSNELKQLAQQEKKEENRLSVIDAKLKSVITAKDKYKTWGVQKSGLTLAVTNVINDEQHSYFKVLIDNNTGAEYEVDYLYFEFIDKSSASLLNFKKENKPKRLMPIRQTKIQKIPSYSTQTIGYVTDLFSVNYSGNLVIMLGEKNGIRHMKLKINAKQLAKVDVFRN